MKHTMKRWLCALAALVMLASLTACGQKTDTLTVRYLNFKPEIAAKYEELARIYEEETGVKVVVETAANNTYEQTLTAKMATSDAPTLFQINGPRGYAAWKSYCADLSDTQLYQHLTDKSLALTDGDKVVGIPYVVEGYGIIYNRAIMDKYFALTDRQQQVNSVDEINNFDRLRTVVEDMQKHRDAIGIKGVFASTSLKSGEDWRWQTHLVNIPVYYEFADGKIDLTGDDVRTLQMKYADNLKNIFDLYTDNSVTDKKLLGSKTVSDSMAEFALGQCAMVQNGNWAWDQIDDVAGNTVDEEDVKYLPIYTGIEGEETQGLCIGTENYYAINSKATEEEQKAAADFIYWLYSSDTGKEYVTDEFGFIPPFDTFEEDEQPDDPLASEVLRYMKNTDVTTIPWNFTLFPSSKWKEDFGASLLSYVQGSKKFEDVITDAANSWKTEYDAVK